MLEVVWPVYKSCEVMIEFKEVLVVMGCGTINDVCFEI
jgi:hypothetical protein